MGCCESVLVDENGNPLENRIPFQFQMLAEHGGGINCMSMAEDGSVLATGGEDKTVRVFNSNALPCECISILEGHDGYISCLAVEENYILTGSKDNTVRKWELVSGRCLFTCKGHKGVINRIVCCENFIFSSSYDKTARCWDWNTGECLYILKGHQKGVYSMIYIPGDLDGSELSSLQAKHLLLTSSTDNTTKLWNVLESTCLITYSGHEGPITCMTADANGTTLFTGSTDKRIRSYRTLTGELLQIFSGHRAGVVTLCFTNGLLFSGSSDHTVRAWFAETGNCVRQYKGQGHTVNTVRVYNGLVITTCGDGVIRVYCARSGKLIRKFEGHTLSVNSAKLIGNRLYSSAYDGTLRIWDMRGCREQMDLTVDPIEEIRHKIEKKRIAKVNKIAVADDKVPVLSVDHGEIDSGLDPAFKEDKAVI